MGDQAPRGPDTQASPRTFAPTAVSGRQSALDGIRAVACLAVVVCHVHTPGCHRLGLWAVEVFFALSGYLVAGIVLRPSGVRPRAFLGARIRRLWPAMAAMVTVTWIIAALVAPSARHDMAIWSLHALTFTEPLFRAGGGYSPLLGHTWTIGVEMAFYCAAPVGIPWAARFGPRAAPALLIAAAVMLAIALASPIHFAEPNPWPFLLGVALALQPGPAPAWVQAAGVILSWRPLRSVGLLSYGIYLWHYPMVAAVTDQPWWIQLAIVLPLSTLLSALSYLTIERWSGCAKTPLDFGRILPRIA